jgi:hypothetical protein
MVLLTIIGVAGFSTMLLAAAAVSKGCFLGVYAVYTLLMTALYFGEAYTFTSSLANAFIAFGGLIGVSSIPLIEQGGLSAVAEMWTMKGTTNQFAVWRNLLIAVCWGLACVFLGIIIPPWRTSRKMITQGLFPFIFKQVSTVLSGEDVDLQVLAKSKTALKKGKVAMTTIFEPLIFRLGVNLVDPLKTIAVECDELIFKSALVLKWKKGLTEAPNELENLVLDDTSKLLETCGNALMSNDPEHLNKLRDFVNDKAFDHMAEVGSPGNSVEATRPELSNSYYIYEQANRVRVSVLSYLRALNTGITVTNNSTFHSKTALLYFVVPLIPEIRMVTFCKTIFHPNKWNLSSIMWSLELSAGFVALISMSLYWDEYSDFRIVPSDSYVGPVYSGWQLCAYAYAYCPSHEGTVKKGMQRIIGTCLGGLLAWLGIIVCSGSYNDNSEINPYGLVAWLTIFTMLCGYFYSLGSGVSAHFGKDKDHGYVGTYFTATQALIALDVYLGKGDKNGLTLNRIVATITGVMMAILISFLPPHVNGRDPKHTREYLNAVNDAYLLLLRTFADESKSSEISSDVFQKSLLVTAEKKKGFAVFMLNDADMLQVLPFLKVNPKLRPLLDGIAVAEASVQHLLDGFADIISKDLNVNETRISIQRFLQNFDDTGNASETDTKFAKAADDRNMAVDWTYDIARLIARFKRALDEMEE